MASNLASLPEVERLSPAVVRILGGNPGKFTLQGTNTYLVGSGPQRILIDTAEGRPSWIAALRRLLEQEKAHIQQALITHWHHDHVGGIQDLLGLNPSTTIHKFDPQGGQHPIADGQEFEVQGATLTAVHSPGHTTDHVAFVLREEDALFTGDNVLGHGTAVFEDLGTYLQSLAKMKPLVQGRAYPGHGAILHSAPAKIEEYISHRKQREDQVLELLASGDGDSMHAKGGAWAVMDLVKIIYRDVPESLHIPAAGGVSQILRKLEAEDRVVLESEERWRLRDRSSL
ncbi:putative metallo-beta-lactamase domain protein [Microdochium trichocladiopsis]|uniref:Metallo-beta-lactamase domain protein n=1 Tax=Microdochium trichocladiopsis TaxID=1682393 RepID=A0A9P8Y4S1_9PEZI|nr:putative metallo-beta-lactamase domain protein [Microdochium trichocladiopsis]KAH7029344.1 putative metallo-beta-lactamase domain protein [Microdochium trichocladiopsis]